MMSRPVLALVAVALGVAALGPRPAPAADPPRPNVLVVLADDLGYGDLGCYGSPVIKTPNLDAFAAEGVRLTACYAAAPNCSPSRAGLLTGRTPSRVGVYDVIQPNANMRLRDREVNVAELLKGVGYDTCHVGKWHLTPARKKDQRAAAAARQHGFDHTRSGPDEGGTPLRAAAAVDELTRWIGGRKDPARPFFAYLALTEPHEDVGVKVDPPFRTPYDGLGAEAAARAVPYGGVPRPAKAAWENRTAYFGCVTQMDAAFGRLMKYLDDNKLRDTTLVLFTSDNGPEHRAAHSFGSPGPLRGAKGHVFEGGIRVPGMVRWPGRVEPGTTSAVPVCGTDLLPTLCALTGAKVPADRVLDGVDLLPALGGRDVKRPVPLYWSMWAGRGGPQYAMRDGDWKLLAFTDPLPDGRKVIDHIKAGGVVRYELYDLKADPGEKSDRARADPEVFDRMKQSFLRLHRQVLAEGPAWDLEEHRGKARQAWPGAYRKKP